jgi:superfamily II DNA or RNA helicase
MPTPVPLPGSLVWIRQRRWRIARAVRRRNVLRLDVEHRDRRLTFLAPFDRPSFIERSDRPRRAGARHALARLAGLLGRAPGWRAVLSAVDARVALLPHQLEPVLAVLGGARRVLVADAVGLGKTIQAGLVIAELVRHDPAARVLVIVPAALRAQWRDELHRRFGLAAIEADRPALDGLARDVASGANPWARPGVWLASADFLKQPHVRDALPPTPWDAVVVDEAHDACGHSERHEASDELARRARHVILLTGTPHSGDDARFGRLMDLGRLGRADSMVVFRRTRRDIGAVARREVRWHRVRPDPDQLALLDALTAFERAVLESGSIKRDAALLLLSVFRKRALSTATALATSVARRLSIVDMTGAGDLDWMHQPRLAFDDDPEDDVDEATRDALVADIGFNRRQERSWLRRLQTLARRAARREAKIARLDALIDRVHEPVVVFTEFRQSLEIVAARIAQGRIVATLHGGQQAAERRRELARFLEGPASVLVATDVAGQGLNLHERSRWVVSLELPWNPVRLEQRIGRVDRIGQTRAVHLTVLVTGHATETGLLENLARRALRARAAMRDGDIDLPAPDESAVAAALIGGATLEPRRPARQMDVCRRWSRPATQAARCLEWRRALVRRWRGPVGVASRPVLAQVRKRVALSPAPARWLLVFTVPLVDGSGLDVERRVVAVRVAANARTAEVEWRNLGSAAPAWVEEARRAAEQSVARRARALARRLANRATTLTQIEREIARGLVTSRCPEETELGLFDRRELRVFEAARRDVDEIHKTMTERVRALEAHSRISVGRPLLELVLDFGR